MGRGSNFVFAITSGSGGKETNKAYKRTSLTRRNEKKKKNFKIIAQTVAEVLSEIVSEQFTIHAISKLPL